jgi:hypothetical protein
MDAKKVSHPDVCQGPDARIQMRLALALATEKGGTLANSILLNSVAAARAWLTILAINLKLLGKVSGLAITVLKVSEGGASLLDCGPQYSLYVAREGVVLF